MGRWHNKTGVCNWRYDAQCSASLCFEAPGHVILAPSCKLRSQRACSHERPREIGSKTRNATALGSLIRLRAVTSCNLAVSDMYMRDFGKTHQIAYTYCSVGISDLKPLTGTSADQLPHRKSQSLATA